ncbi:MAG: HEPN domain-containing protein [Ruminococcus sp.]|nr:HEPN domain-containing protein [Ruminococcus sp.]
MKAKRICLKNCNCICVHGMKISNSFSVQIKNVNIYFFPYDTFQSVVNPDDFVNLKEMVVCDSVAVIEACFHNSIEVQLIKSAISMAYFSNRIAISEKSEKNMEERENQEIENFLKQLQIDKKEKKYNEIKNKMKEKDAARTSYFQNYMLNGFWNQSGAESRIEPAFWYVKLGQTAPTNDDYDMWLSRIYGTNQQDAFFKRDGIEKRDKLLGTVEIDEPFCSVLHKIQERIHQKDLYASKLLSVFSIYYSVLRNFSNSEQECISFCTILETLLLGKDEDKQRKKVSVRAACLIADGEKVEKKKFLATQIYMFYLYRNGFVHDGKSILDFDWGSYQSSYQAIKHVIYYCIKNILYRNIRCTKEITAIVEKNAKQDGLENAFNYIDENINYLNYNE